MARKRKDVTKTASDGTASGRRPYGKPAVAKGRNAANPLTVGMQRFAQCYLVRRNATRAYQDAYPGAGYNSASTSGSALLRDPRVKVLIDRGLADESERLTSSARRVSDALASIAFVSMADFFDQDGKPIPLHELPREVAMALKTLKPGEFQLFDRIAALRLLGLEQSMFTEKTVHVADDALLNALRAARERALIE